MIVPLFDGWVLKKANPDTERYHLNKILAEIFGRIGDGANTFVRIIGDTMTGNLGFQHPLQDAATSSVIQPTSNGDLNIATSDPNNSVYINVSTADTTNLGTGTVTVGRFRNSIPIYTATDAEVLQSGTNGVGSAIVLAGTGVETLVIRKNNGTSNADWFLGNYFSVCQYGTDQVVISGQTDVNLLIPAGFIAAPRDQYSVITCTLIAATVTEDPPDTFTYDDETWLVSGDLAEAI